MKPTDERFSNDTSAPRPDPIVFPLGSGPTVRGVIWPGGPDTVVLIHDVGDDLDSWGSLPAVLTGQGYRVVAVDLPGHGLSDDPWDSGRAPEQIAEIVSDAAPPDKRCFVIGGGSLAPVIGDLAVDALVMISPHAPAGPVRPGATSPCLIFVGGADPEFADAADRFFRARRGWAVVSSFGVAENGAALLSSEWASHLAEQTITFLRDYRTPSPQ